MNQKYLIKALLCLSTVVGIDAATPSSQTIPLSTTPAALSCAVQRYVNKFTVRVIPGFEGKVFVGIAGMSTTTYANTLAILYPNLGAHSEEYVVQDLSGDDGIDLCSIYVAGGITGERAVAEYVSNNGGVVAPTYLMVPYFVQVVDGSNPVNMYSVSSRIRIQTIPGQEGKQYILAGYGTEIAELFPNTGNLSQHSAWSEYWELSDPLGNNGLIQGGEKFTISQQIPGEKALMSMWRKVSAANQLQTTQNWWYFIVASLKTSGFTFPDPDLDDSAPPSFAYDLRVRQVPGNSSKIYLGNCDSGAYDNTGDPYAVLFPNTLGSVGWSESFSPGVANDNVMALNNFCVGADQKSDVDVEYLSPVGWGAPIPPAAMSSLNGQYTSLITLSSTPISINRGSVSYLRAQVVPGQVGKIYIGSVSMNISTLAGVYAVLYPNTIGRWSETLEIKDPEGDGIPTDSFYVAAEVPGEQVMVYTSMTSIIPPDGFLTVKASGPLAGSFSSYAVPFAKSSTPISILRAQAIPGGDGKLWIGTSKMTAAQPDNTYANALKVLWPSQGNYNVGEGHSERFTQACHAGPVSAPNCLDLQNFTFWPYIPSEQLLVFALGR